MSRSVMKGSITVMVFVVFLIGAISASAEIPKKINYQGKLTDADTGEPLTGSQTMTFRLFDDPSSGSLLWSESVSVSADSAGIFSVILGQVAPIDISFERPVWLEIEIDSEVLAPRRELVSVPYSFHTANSDVAVDADMLDGLHASAFADTAHSHDDRYYEQDSLSTAGVLNDAANPVDWTRLKNVPAGFADGADDVGGGVGDGHSLDASDGDPVDALYVDEYGKIGIGTTAPEQPLHVFGDRDAMVEIVIENPNTGAYSAERLSFDNEDGSLAGIAIFDQAGPMYPSQMRMFNNRPGGSLKFIAEGITVMTLKDGRVGVGEANPSEILDVDGTASMTGFKLPTGASSGRVLTSDPTGYGSWQTAAVGDGHSLDAADGAPVDALYVSSSGSVGIGTTAPVQRLHLDGGNSDECFVRFTHDGVGATVNDGFAIGIDNGGDVRLWNSEAGDLNFGTNATQRMKITSSGNVGIGLTVPQTDLHLHNPDGGSCQMIMSNTATGSFISDGLRLGMGNTGDAFIVNYENGVLNLGAGALATLTVDPNARVGINEDEPNYELNINKYGVGTDCYMQMTNYTIGTSQNDGLLLGIDNLGSAKLVNQENGNLMLGTDDQISFTITPGGDFGLGTSVPQTHLHVHEQEVAQPNYMHFTVNATGSGQLDGMNVGIGSDGGANFWNYENTNMRFATNGLERMRIEADGRIGIGEQNPGEMLDIKGNDPFVALNTTNNKTGLRLQKNGSTEWEMAWNEGSGYLYFYNAGTRVVIEDATGDVGIGTTTPGNKLDVAGAAHASSFPTSSDARFKENVEQLTGVLDRLDRVRGVKFDWNSRYEAMGRATGHREIGVIAQEIEEEFPELVTTWGEDDYRAVDYGRMAGVFIEAIKELRSENEALRQRIEALEQATD